MAWDSTNMSPFDLAEFQRSAGELGIGSVVGIDCSVDLKLGGFAPAAATAERWKDRRPPALAPVHAPAPASQKRGRASGAGASPTAATAACLVEGCRADLSKCRDYHRRHKVCEEHSKTQVVVVAGQQQRFCQQCSRFHLLVEFDEVKRSCRKRLDGHNRRRRKPQPDPMNSGSLFSNHQVGRFTSFPQMFPTGTREPHWSGVIKAEEDALFLNQHPLSLMDPQQNFSLSFSGSFKEGKHYPFMQSSDDASLSTRIALDVSVCHPQLKPFAAPSASSSTKMFSEGITQDSLNSDCALSLLSSPAQAAAINLGQIVCDEHIPMGQPLVSGLEYASLSHYSHAQTSQQSISTTGFSCSGIADDQTGGVLISSTSTVDAADLHCQGLFHVATSEGSNGTSHSLPFSWQ